MLKSAQNQRPLQTMSSFPSKELVQGQACFNTVFRILLALSHHHGHGGIILSLTQSLRSLLCSKHSFSHVRLVSLSQSSTQGFSSPRLHPVFVCVLTDTQGTAKTIHATLDDIKFLLQSHLCSCEQKSSLPMASVDDILVCDGTGRPLRTSSPLSNGCPEATDFAPVRAIELFSCCFEERVPSATDKWWQLALLATGLVCVVDVHGILRDACMWSSEGWPAEIATARYAVQAHSQFASFALAEQTDHLSALALVAESALAMRMCAGSIPAQPAAAHSCTQTHTSCLQAAANNSFALAATTSPAPPHTHPLGQARADAELPEHKLSVPAIAPSQHCGAVPGHVRDGAELYSQPGPSPGLREVLAHAESRELPGTTVGEAASRGLLGACNEAGVDSDLLELPCVQFNQTVRLRGLAPHTIALLKQARRRMKNRVYAKRSRARKCSLAPPSNPGTPPPTDGPTASSCPGSVSASGLAGPPEGSMWQPCATPSCPAPALPSTIPHLPPPIRAVLAQSVKVPSSTGFQLERVREQHSAGCNTVLLPHSGSAPSISYHMSGCLGPGIV